jgi:hypothetical protein
MKRKINLNKLSKTALRKLNSIARKHGLGKCTGLIIDEDAQVCLRNIVAAYRRSRAA